MVLSTLLALVLPTMAKDDAPPSSGKWLFAESGKDAAIYEIRGAGKRQNPLRRPLAAPFDGDTLFVRFRLTYAAETIDSPPEKDGEFFVLWLDSAEGGEASTHSGGIPNLGIHVKDGRANHFMARFSSGPGFEVYGAPLVGDRETLVVGRLSKSKPGKGEAFDRLALWVDPSLEDLDHPQATIDSDRGKVSAVSWFGFSTGGKTEDEDRIRVRDFALAGDWETILSEAPDHPIHPAIVSLPKPVEALPDSEIPPPPAYLPPAPSSEIVEVDPAPVVTTDHWAFQPMGHPGIPEVANADWVRSPIDAFIARKQEELGLTPAPPADPATLARRMSLVMTGLPPDPDQVIADFDAYAEALLESPAYGERWGRHWLDVARWAESNGHQHNRDRDHAWRYRDWVVDAFNDDKPYDAFLREQIAGDELSPFSPDNIVATGFLAAARYSGNELDKDIQRNDILVDIVNTTSKAFLGLTMECAQCHNHFFDPITQWDYYHLMAFFAQGQPGDVVLDQSAEAGKLIDQRWGLFESVRNRMIEAKRASGVPEPVLVIPKSVPGGMTRAEKLKFTEIEQSLEQFPKAWAFYSPVTSPHRLDVAPNAMRWPLPFQRSALDQVKIRFLSRGDIASPGPVADPEWPQIFGPTDDKTIGERPRLALANWLTNPEHPLTARVWVNRIWQGHFGRGLVATSGDFGEAGSAPSHPELLDWLARELIASGWSTKHIHRLILQSNTFRQGNLFSASNVDRDPENAALWRWEPRRLEAEAIRDSVLAIAGKLDPKPGGPSVALEQAETSQRRSLYLQQKRDNLPHQQMLFDGAGAVTSCARRRVSTTGLQPLWMLNSEFMQTMAKELSGRIEEATPRAQGERLVKLVYGRNGEADELDQLATLIRESSLEDAVTVILNTNEFVYVP
ncbi:MAG: DUF1553 domain-containing protein [Verrucomicrobiae bacterium]|nr:DUF1553 domain-containing protein [Verrucomicrobiae bacterium]